MNYDWLASAACKAKPVNVFFPEADEKNFDPRPAKAICATCPVRGDCLSAGMKEADGVWGGMTLMERKRLKRGGGPQRCKVCGYLTVSYVNGTVPPCCKRCDENLLRADPHIEHLRAAAYEPKCPECRARAARYKRAWKAGRAT